MTHTRWIAGALALTLGSLAMGGCYYDFGHDRDDPSPTTAGSYPGSSSSATRWTGRADTFRGDLGNVTRFDDSQATITGSDYGTSSSSVRIDAENTDARWWAMTQLSFSGSLHHPDLVPGARLVFSRTRRPSSSSGATPLFVTVLGCSGPRRDSFTYDHPADEVTVVVSAGPTADTQRLSFDATFAGPDGEQHVNGSFVYEPQ